TVFVCTAAGRARFAAVVVSAALREFLLTGTARRRAIFLARLQTRRIGAAALISAIDQRITDIVLGVIRNAVAPRAMRIAFTVRRALQIEDAFAAARAIFLAHRAFGAGDHRILRGAVAHKTSRSARRICGVLVAGGAAPTRRIAATGRR